MQRPACETKAECVEPPLDLYKSELVETDLSELHHQVADCGVGSRFIGDGGTDDQSFNASKYFLSPGQGQQFWSVGLTEIDLAPMTTVPAISASSLYIQQPTTVVPSVHATADCITLFPRPDPNFPSVESQQQQQQQHSSFRIGTDQASEMFEQPHGPAGGSPQWQQQQQASDEELPRKRKIEVDLDNQRDPMGSLRSSSSSSSAVSAQPLLVPHKKRRKGKLLLWQFLLNDLLEGRTCISWMDQRANPGVFKFTDANQAARRWGHYKENENMSYEKMSRCIRDYWIRDDNKYYRTMIPDFEKGRRLHFAFNLEHPEVLRFIKNRSSGYFEKLVAEGVIKPSQRAAVTD